MITTLLFYLGDIISLEVNTLLGFLSCKGLDEFKFYKTVVLIDSNIVLEALPLQDLPWSEIDPIGPILILLVPTLLKEIDSKKRDGRLSVRARTFNRFIGEIALEKKPKTICNTTLQVDITFARCKKIDWNIYDDLDPSQGDDRIIAEILHITNIPHDDIVFVSQDMYPIVLAQRHNIKTFHIQEHWLPLPEKSLQEKEIINLKRQILDLNKTEPEFNIELHSPINNITVFKIAKLREDELFEVINEIIEENPIREQSFERHLTALYDHTLTNRYIQFENEDVPTFVQNYHEQLETLYCQFPFSFTIKNKGNVAAENIFIETRIIGGWFNSKPILAGTCPRSPSIKSPILFDSHNFYKKNSPTTLIDRHEVKVNLTSRCDTFSAQCEVFRLNQKWKFEGIVWIDPHFTKETTIIIKITSSNKHGELVEPIKVHKIVSNKNVFDLVDRKTKIPVENYPIKSLILSYINTKNYDAFERVISPSKN